MSGSRNLCPSFYDDPWLWNSIFFVRVRFELYWSPKNPCLRRALPSNWALWLRNIEICWQYSSDVFCSLTARSQSTAAALWALAWQCSGNGPTWSLMIQSFANLNKRTIHHNCERFYITLSLPIQLRFTCRAVYFILNAFIGTQIVTHYWSAFGKTSIDRQP